MCVRESSFVLLLILFFGTRSGVTFRTSYTKSPLLGYRCVMDDPSNLMTFTNTARPQCVWRCLSLRDCMVVSHNGVDDTCELAMQRCDRLQTHLDFSVNVYGIDRKKCTNWVSAAFPDERKAVVFPQGTNGASKIAVSRIVLDTGVYPGKLMPKTPFHNKFLSVVAVSATEMTSSRNGQVFLLSPSCQPAWIPYSLANSSEISGPELVVGGRIGNKEDVYVARARFGYISSIGYYRPRTGLGYFVVGGKANASVDYLEMLVLV